MRKEIVYDLEYRIDGETKIVKIKIDFVSRGVMSLHSDISSMADRAVKANDRLSDIYSEIAVLKIDSGKEKEIEELKKELDEITAVILEFNSNGYFEKRFDLIRRLLVDNGYKTHEFLVNPEFWDNNVDPFDINDFLVSVIYKDIDMRKKKMM